MGGSQSRQSKPTQDINLVVDRMITNPQTPVEDLLKLRDSVFAQKSAINKSQQRALRVVLDSIGQTQKAEDSYQKLTKAIRNKTNAARRKVSNVQQK